MVRTRQSGRDLAPLVGFCAQTKNKQDDSSASQIQMTIKTQWVIKVMKLKRPKAHMSSVFKDIINIKRRHAHSQVTQEMDSKFILARCSVLLPLSSSIFQISILSDNHLRKFGHNCAELDPEDSSPTSHKPPLLYVCLLMWLIKPVYRDITTNNVVTNVMQ